MNQLLCWTSTLTILLSSPPLNTLVLVNFHTCELITQASLRLTTSPANRQMYKTHLQPEFTLGRRFCGTGGWFPSYWLDSHTHPRYDSERNQPKHRCPTEEAEKGNQGNGLRSLPFRKGMLQMPEWETASPCLAPTLTRYRKEIPLQSYLTFYMHLVVPHPSPFRCGGQVPRYLWECGSR